MNKWIGITGTWQTVDAAVEKDVRRAIREILSRGDGVVTGGALGVDYIATDETLRNDSGAEHLKIILPTSLTDYANHYFRRAAEGVITYQQASDLVKQLEEVRSRNPEAIEEMAFAVCNQATYYARNTRVVEKSDQLLAFQVNNSAGTQDTIDKARAAGKRVSVINYSVP